MSDQQQGDMVGIDSSDTAAILEHLGDNNVEQSKHWPQALIELIEVLTASRVQSGIEENDAKEQGLTLAIAISTHFGGSQFYLPKPNGMKKFVRDIRLYRKFTGHNHKQLAREYDLTEVQVYSIVRQQYQLQHAKLQPDMFKQK